MIRGLGFHGSKVPFDSGAFSVFSDLFKSDRDDKFVGGFDASLWSESAVNCTTSVDKFHEVVFGAGSSSYELTGYTLPAGVSVGFSYGFHYKKTGSTSGDVVAHKFTMDAGSKRLDVEFIYNDATSNRVEISDASSTLITYEITGQAHSATVLKVSTDFYFWVDGTYIGTVNGGIGSFDVSVASYDPAATGSVVYKPFSQLPVVTGVTANGDVPVPVPSYKNGIECVYEFTPYLPGVFEITAHGTGSSAGTTEVAGDLTVLLDRKWMMKPQFMLSTVDNLDSDGAQITTCPTYGVPADSNSGDLILANQCFCDGSAKDTSPVDFFFKKGARLTKGVNRKRMPEFFADDGSTVYGRNNDFLRVHHPDTSLDLATAGERLAFLRTLKLSDGRVIYYGVAKDEDTSKNIYADFGYDISYYQSLDTGVDRDEWAWVLYEEDGETIIAQSDDPIYYSTRTSLNNYFDNSGGYYRNLAPGRYFLELKAMRYSDSDNGEEDAANEGARMSVTVREGTTGADPIIAQGYAEAREIDDESSFTQVNNFGRCLVQFTVEERLGRLVVYEFDPCTDSVTKYEATAKDVDLRTKSLVAFEHGDDVIFLYHQVSSDFYDERSGELHYVKFNAGFSDTGSIFVPKLGFDKYLYAFDGYSQNALLSLYLSAESEDEYIYSQTRVSDSSFSERILKRNKPFTPCGPRGIYHYDLDLGDITFDGSNYSFRDYESNRIVLESLSAMFSQEATARFHYDDGTNEVEDFKKWDFPQRVRVKWSDDFNMAVLSVLDLDTRCPVILMGRRGAMKEVAIPLHFQMYEGMPTTRSSYRLTHYAIDDFCAALSPDGMIYSIASKDELVEIGLNDPAFYWEGKDLLVKIVEDYYSRAPYEIYKPPVRFEAIPFHSFDNGDDTNEKVMVDIEMNHHYVTCAIQSEKYSYTPCIYSSGFYDNVPFETFCENVWVPCLEDNASAYASTNATHVGDSVKLQNLTGVTSSMEATLDKTTCYKDRYWYLDQGYKVHARIMVEPAAGTSVTEPVEFYANFEKAYLRRGMAAFWISGDTAEARVYDYGSSSWEVVETFTGLPAEPLDFYILIQAPGESDAGRAAFVIKRPSSLSSLYNSSEHTLEYTCSSEISLGFDFRLDTGYSSDESTFGVRWNQNTSGSDRLEYCYVYELGYNLLNAATGVDELGSVSKDGSPVDVYTSDHFDGRRLYSFDDSKIFEYAGAPQYGFPIYTFSGKQSHSFHWYNGFSYRWSGSSTFSNDLFTLQRSVLNAPEEALGNNLHGLWLSSNDSSDVVLSSDANADGLEKYAADTFVVSGVNVTEVEVLGRDNSGDPWESIGTIDMRVFRIDSPSYQQTDTKCVISHADMRVPFGMSKAVPGYIYDGTQMLKIVSNTETAIVVEAPSGYTVSASTLYWIRGKGVLQTEATNTYRYIGFKFSAVDTFEGYFMAENVDFGMASKLPVGQNYDSGGGKTISVSIDYDMVYDSQPHKFAPSTLVTPNYTFTFSTLEAQTFAVMMTIFDRADFNRKPIWVIESFNDEPYEPNLCLPDGAMETNHYLDDEFEDLFTVTLSMKGVSE